MPLCDLCLGIENRLGKTFRTKDENIDLGEFRTVCCCTDDPHFGG